MNAPLIFIGIDGTGPADDAKYSAAFKNSFVKTLSERVFAAWTFYHRGPTLTGSATKSYAETASAIVSQVESIVEWKSPGTLTEYRPWTVSTRAIFPLPDAKPSIRICLAGYSRGAAAAVVTAQMLGERGISVDYLVLFDAVDRSPNFRFTGMIGRNVRQAWHAFRSKSAESREIFGNTATAWDKDSTWLCACAFHATHGGIGGTPWCTDPAYAPRFAGGLSSPAWNQPINEAKLASMETALAAGALAVSNYQNAPFIFTSPLNAIGSIAASARVHSTTNVTFREDLEGARKVWAWLVPQLKDKGLIADGSCPLDGIESKLGVLLTSA